MKATGIVRRIDDLGRVVIPKEIRRTMRIREGDPLEIFTGAGGEVIFKKYSPVGELKDIAEIYVQAMGRNVTLPVLICDRESCVAQVGIPKKEFPEKSLSPALQEALEERKEMRFEEKRIEIFESEAYTAAFICPIIAAGDLCGCVMLMNVSESKTPTESDINLVRVAAGFLGKQLEE